MDVALSDRVRVLDDTAAEHNGLIWQALDEANKVLRDVLWLEGEHALDLVVALAEDDECELCRLVAGALDAGAEEDVLALLLLGNLAERVLLAGRVDGVRRGVNVQEAVVGVERVVHVGVAVGCLARELLLLELRGAVHLEGALVLLSDGVVQTGSARGGCGGVRSATVLVVVSCSVLLAKAELDGFEVLCDVRAA